MVALIMFSMLNESDLEKVIHNQDGGGGGSSVVGGEVHDNIISTDTHTNTQPNPTHL